MYVVFIDASKAFDRIRYDHVFGILIKRGLPPIIKRTIMDMYERQESRVMWDNEYGDYFKCINGVRQGGVVSPLMFAVYMNELIKELQSAGIGCYVCHEYFGCVSYADDMALLCPSIKGLQQLIEICERLGETYSVKYNAKKSMCMVYDEFVDRSVQFNDGINIMLNGSRLIWSNWVKHLGNYIKYDLSEYEEIRHKRQTSFGESMGYVLNTRMQSQK